FRYRELAADEVRQREVVKQGDEIREGFVKRGHVVTGRVDEAGAKPGHDRGGELGSEDVMRQKRENPLTGQQRTRPKSVRLEAAECRPLGSSRTARHDVLGRRRRSDPRTHADTWRVVP